jgi:VanZ family protein
VKTIVLEYWLPILLWLGAIFFFSTDAFSSRETSRIIVPVLTFIFPNMPPDRIDIWHEVIRKFGHIIEYFILAVFLHRALKYDQPELVGPKLRSMTFILLAALLDEFHQSFVPSRGPSIVDVGYDCLGGVWALWLITGFEARRLRSHSIL